MLGNLALKFVELGRAEELVLSMEKDLLKAENNHFIPPFPICDLEGAKYRRDKLEREVVALSLKIEEATKSERYALYSNKEYKEKENATK